jgi:hypothetical protein
MAEKHLKRPRDPMQLAKLVGDIATGEVEDRQPEGPPKNPAAPALSALGASKSGTARAEKLSSKKRKQIARKAAHGRWTTHEQN